MSKKSKPVVIKSAKKVFVDHDFPASAVGFELAKLAAHLVESGLIRREWFSNDIELAVRVMNFAADCDEVILRFQMERDFALKHSGTIQVPSRITGNGLAWLAGSLVKAKLVTAADVGGDSRKLAEKALQFCVTCFGAHTGRNRYVKEDFERKNGWGLRLNPFRKFGKVPLAVILEWAGLTDSTLVNEFKAEGVPTIWENLSGAERTEEMFRYLTREPVDMRWDALHSETGLAHEWSGKAKVGDEGQINEMVAAGVPCEDVPRVVEALKLAKKRKESAQKRRAGVAAAALKKKVKKDAERA